MMGPSNEHVLQFLKAVKADVAFKGEKSEMILDNIPSFVNVVEFCKKNDVWMNIEIKPFTGDDKRTGKVVAGYTRASFIKEISSLTASIRKFDYCDIKRRIQELPLFSSFSYEALLGAQEAAPEIPRAFLIKDMKTVPDWKLKARKLNVVAIHTRFDNITPELIAEIKSQGYACMCYTVNEVSQADELFDLGVDAICTDTLDNMIRYLRKDIGLIEEEDENERVWRISGGSPKILLNEIVDRQISTRKHDDEYYMKELTLNDSRPRSRSQPLNLSTMATSMEDLMGMTSDAEPVVMKA
jgi:glycerophosphoryl diester phosphodiesterase